MGRLNIISEVEVEGLSNSEEGWIFNSNGSSYKEWVDENNDIHMKFRIPALSKIYTDSVIGDKTDIYIEEVIIDHLTGEARFAKK